MQAFPLDDSVGLNGGNVSVRREDAQAPKRVSWAKSNTGSDAASKNGTLSSIATTPRPRDPHPPAFHYPYTPVPTSDSGSVVHAYTLRPGDAGPLQGLPGYNGTPSGKLSWTHNTQLRQTHAAHQKEQLSFELKVL